MENFIRKNWLISFSISNINILLTAIFLSPCNMKLFTWIISIFWIAIAILTLYFAYIKKGTKWISAIIGIRFFTLVLTGIIYSYYIFTNQFYTFFITATKTLPNINLKLYIAINIIGYIIGIYYLFSCYKLRKINVMHVKMHAKEKVQMKIKN